MNLQRVQGQPLPRVGLSGVSLGLKVEPGAVLELTQAVPGARLHRGFPSCPLAPPPALVSPTSSPRQTTAPGHGLIGILCFTGDAKGRRIKIV